MDYLIILYRSLHQIFRGGTVLNDLTILVQKSIWEAIQAILPQSITNAPFDKTVEGTIIEDLGNSKYNVIIEGVVYTIPSYVNLTLVVGDTVKVTYPQNQINKKYISGKVVN